MFTVSPVSVRSTSTFQRDSAEDHSILVTRWLKRILRSTPLSSAASRT